MFLVAMKLVKTPLLHVKFLYNVKRVAHYYVLHSIPYITSLDFAMDSLLRYRQNNKCVKPLTKRHFMAQETTAFKDISEMTVEEVEKEVTDLLPTNNNKRIIAIVKNYYNSGKPMSDETLKKLFLHYSNSGRPDIVELLQKYCSKVNVNLFKRNGRFIHYVAKAQCMKGNSERGLLILTECYTKNPGLRNFYRLIFSELVQDSVLNRSEATLVIFKKYVMKFSDEFAEHYPLICLWHICWSSSWFSDQMLANELIDESEPLQNIIKERASAFSITILKEEYNEDAVYRLLQILLKFKFNEEYVNVLQTLFNFKLRNRDLRGCREIVRNCEILGLSLTADQQSRYIKMLINGPQAEYKPSTTHSNKNFKLKF